MRRLRQPARRPAGSCRRAGLSARVLLAGGISGALLMCCGLAALSIAGCHTGRRGATARAQPGAYPPAPYVPRAVALGNLRGVAPPTAGEIELAVFLFGVEPPPPLTIANPTGLAATADSVLVCDAVLATVLRWDAHSGRLDAVHDNPAYERPFAIDITPAGEQLVCGRSGVFRCGADGHVVCSYRPPAGNFKPAGVLAVDQTVWVSNAAEHRVEVFDAATGRHLRSIGGHGTARGQFAFPRGMARTPDGDVCIVDMLNNRVQVLGPDGQWRRDIGQPGRAVGLLGRPKDVAVGPDGTIFVTDAFSQRIHAFAPDGALLLSFGEPGSGIGELALPNGIVVATEIPRTDRELPDGMTPAYFVLVAEQLLRPGVRAYAWLGDYRVAAREPRSAPVAVGGAPPAAAPADRSPHWDPERCTACHQADGKRLLPIESTQVAEVCRRCHDGHQGGAWGHPVDSPLAGPGLRTPADWPLADGRLTCLTCHDVKRHCSAKARRDQTDVALLRGADPRGAAGFCGQCHVDTAGWSGSPHGHLDDQGRLNRQSCLFCHREVPAVPGDGVRRFEPKLRTMSGSCLNCHERHWDYFPAAHVDRLVPPRIRQYMLAREVGAGTTGAGGQRAQLPLADGRIACYTCHNPHQRGLFPPQSELAARAVSPTDAAYRLRIDRPGLCLHCHEK